MASANRRDNPYYQAQAILSRRGHSVWEVRQKMKRQGFKPDQADSAVAKLQKLGLLDDRAYAEAYIRDTLRAKPVGPRWLKHKLRQRGVSEDITGEVLGAAFSGGREERLARKAAQKWRRLHPRHGNDRRRLSRFLSSRGFTHGAINAVLT